MRAEKIPIAWNSGIPIFASEGFLKTVSDEYGWIGGIDLSGKLRCILPYAVIRKGKLFRMVRFQVETIPLEQELGVDEEKSFLNSAVEYLRSAGVDLIIPGAFHSLFQSYPEGAVAAPYGSYIVDLQQPEKTLWNNLHQKHRNVIRNAMKKGITIQSGLEHLETAYDLVRDSFRRSANGWLGSLRSGFKMDFDAFKRQVLGFGENVKVFIAEHEGSVQGCAVIPFSRHSAYYLHGGSVSKPLTGAMNLLQWEAICFFQNLGVRYYNFVGARIDPEPGSKQEGLVLFKQRFGGKLQHGYMWKYSFGSFKNFLYSAAARLRSGGDVVDQEGRKMRNYTVSRIQ